MSQLYFRSIFISDVHLGTRNLQANQLLDFLTRTESEYLYLVGDILDLLQLRKTWHWSKTNDKIVQAVLEKAASGTRVIYIPGNHDHMLRKFSGNTINNIEIVNDTVHETADGRKYLVLHGDKFDPVIQSNPWLARIGSTAYEWLLVVNRYVNSIRRIIGWEYTSLSAWMKHQVKCVVNYMGNYETEVVMEVEGHQAEGLICGHIHRAGIREIGKTLYTNSGDWVESCTALVENREGRLGIVEWQHDNPLGDVIPTKEYENLYRDRCLASSN